MNPNDIKKFNQYCAEVVGRDMEDSYDPYKNLYQLAVVVDELINLTGKQVVDDKTNTDTGTWRIWSNYVINTMLDEGLGPLESKLRLELATYEDGTVSATEFIERIIMICDDYEKPQVNAKKTYTIAEKCKAILVSGGYSFARDPDKLRLEEDYVNPFVWTDDETLELWAWRQSAALENYFEQNPDMWDLWNSSEPYVYDIGISIQEWRQERLMWCIDKLEDII